MPNRTGVVAKPAGFAFSQNYCYIFSIKPYPQG